MIKAILSDFDGTLVDFHAQYDPQIIPLLKKLKEKNITFSLATGRPYYGVAGRYLTKLGLDGPHIFHGGGYIFDTLTKKELLHQPLSANSAKWIIEYLKSTGLLFSVETKSGVFLSKVQPVPTYSDDVPLNSIEKFSQFDSVLKILVFAALNKLPEATAFRYFDDVKAHCKDIELMKILRFGFLGCDITSEKATKHTAVLEYMKLESLTKDEVIGIGDDYNDYPLFTACGYTIAMDNAPPEVKEIANLVVPTTDNGGMRMALEHILQTKV